MNKTLLRNGILIALQIMAIWLFLFTPGCELSRRPELMHSVFSVAITLIVFRKFVYFNKSRSGTYSETFMKAALWTILVLYFVRLLIDTPEAAVVQHWALSGLQLIICAYHLVIWLCQIVECR
jgi:hypothetical protein